MTEKKVCPPIDSPENPFQEGFNSASFQDGGKTQPCPYQQGTVEYDQWWEGFGSYDDDPYHLE